MKAEVRMQNNKVRSQKMKKVRRKNAECRSESAKNELIK